MSRAPQQIFSVRATPSLQRFAAIYSPSATTYIVRLLILCEKLHVAIAIWRKFFKSNYMQRFDNSYP